jgi:spore coat polysaccharide biosynthesis predicted glycosyltransferase SpsG
MSIKLLDILLKSEKSRNLQYYVVLGKGFKNKEKLKDFSKKYANVVLKENVKYMSKIMLECDVAISAGGGTLYELCSCGTPTIAFIVAENQEKLVDKLSRLKYIKSIGWYDEITKNKLISVFNKLCRDKDARKDMSSRGQFLVDGLGGSRITKEIINSLT